MQDPIALPPGWENGPLAEELKTYLANRDELLQTARGKYALVKAREIAGLYDRKDEAFSEAYRRFRLSGFMIKQVLEQEEVVTNGGSSFIFSDNEDEDAPS